jgi:hypothetical protein
MVNHREPFSFVPGKPLMHRTLLIISLLLASGQTQAEKPAATATARPAVLQSPAAEKPAPPVAAVTDVAPQSPTSALVFQSLAQLDEMVALGMSSLALKLLDEEQTRWPQYSPDWYAFEYRGIVLLADSGRWQQLLSRSAELLDRAVPGKQISEQIRQWFISQQVVAHLQLKQPEPALQKARALLWNPVPGVDHAAVDAVLRQLIVRAYLQLDDLDDAQKALQKYQQDYADTETANNEEWLLLQARVLLRTSRYAQAITLLAPIKSDIATALGMLAAVRQDPKASYKLVKSIQQKLDANAKRLLIKKPKATDKPPLSKAEVWAYNNVLYERARLLNDFGQACIALEKMLALGDYSAVLDDGRNTGPDDLWALYERIGQDTGNENKLLLGDDKGWVQLAKKIQDSSPVRTAGLYAALTLNAHDAKSRDMAQRALFELLAKNENGMEVLSQLYLRSKRISDLESVPVELRFALVDYTIASGQIDLAARLMLSLKEPPEDKNPFDWRMRKARVLVLEGNYAEGVKVLRKTIKSITTMDAAMLDQYLQVVFDLQSVEQHEQALELFGLIKYEWLDAKYQRELYFWKAESNYALHRYAQSAWLYLMSARAVDPEMMDLWSQSARYKAADALTKAKLFDDAYTMYSELLAMTPSETRRSWIRQAMQQVELLRNAENNQHEVKS